MAFPRVRIGLAGAPHHYEAARAAAESELDRRQFTGCTDLYLFPNATSTIDSASSVTFKWDTQCDVGATTIDINIYQPSAAQNSLIGKYSGVQFDKGEFTGSVRPYWPSNSTVTWTQVYVSILKSDSTPWDSAIQSGPMFNVTYTPTVVVVSGSALTRPPENTGLTPFLSITETTGKKTSKGVIAVAVVIPIVVVCILAAVAFWFYRIKEKKKLHRWSQALSQHSQLDWEKGALPGERVPSSYGRPSSAYSRSAGRPSTGYGRPSTGYGRPSTGYGRPSTSSNRPTSSVMLENMAGAGAGLRAFPGAADMDPNRSSVVMPDGQVRQSRISFADTARPRLSSDNRGGARHVSGLGYPSTSIDELRNLEAVAYANRGDEIEDLSPLDPADSKEEQQTHDSPSDAAGGNPTVQYGPDQMLAVYARRKGSTSPTPPAPAVTAVGSKVKRFLTRKDKKNPRTQQLQQPEVRVNAPSPEPVQMADYTHLHSGTATASAIDSLPMPGPPRPGSSQSAISRYEDAREHL